ncbi:hypothetical protein EVAR_32063_1 [Eumeta japonica]|uniref:Uncharacterized protein n=1 Tax=Eumeta variegata TaxID=151549 RepID=A0A4C1WQY1_EUMVA|nr:hypothetical protein EVAR_32063_1 [Eumeta japonica]
MHQTRMQFSTTTILQRADHVTQISAALMTVGSPTANFNRSGDWTVGVVSPTRRHPGMRQHRSSVPHLHPQGVWKIREWTPDSDASYGTARNRCRKIA